MAARSVWNGALSFGLVNVPCKLYPAVGEKSVRFNQIDTNTGSRIKQKRVNGAGVEVKYEDIAKGYEISPDRYVILSDDDLNAVAPQSSRVITLEKFVDLGDIDPMIYDASYYAGPTIGGEQGYRLLRDAMRKSSRAGIGKVVLRSKEKLCVVHATDTVLVISTVVFADEVREQPEVAPAQYAERELAMATMLVESLTEEFDHTEYADEYRAQVMKMIEAKAAGEPFAEPATTDTAAPAPDLFGALTASLEQRMSTKSPKRALSRKAKKVTA